MAAGTGQCKKSSGALSRWALVSDDYGDGIYNCHQDINPSDTLQKESARDHKDERHICPLQKEVIRRAIALWTNPGDIVWDQFGGIGTSGVIALEMDRRAIMSELKDSYYKQNVLNCQAAIQATSSTFDWEGIQ